MSSIGIHKSWGNDSSDIDRMQSVDSNSSVFTNQAADVNVVTLEESQFVDKPFYIDFSLNNASAEISSQLTGEQSLRATALMCDYDIGHMKSLLLSNLNTSSFVTCLPKDVEVLSGSTITLLNNKGSVRVVLKTLSKYSKLYYISLSSSHPRFQTCYVGPFNCCNMKLRVVSSLQDTWFKDTGGKDNCLSVDVDLVDRNGAKVMDRVVKIRCVLCYGSGERVLQQSILTIHPSSNNIIKQGVDANISFKINEVSNKHRGQLFKLEFVPEYNLLGTSDDIGKIGSCYTTPINVKSKTNLRLKRPYRGPWGPTYKEGDEDDLDGGRSSSINARLESVTVIETNPAASSVCASFKALANFISDTAFCYDNIMWKNEPNDDRVHYRNPNSLLNALEAEYLKSIQPAEERIKNYFEAALKKNRTQGGSGGGSGGSNFGYDGSNNTAQRPPMDMRPPLNLHHHNSNNSNSNSNNSNNNMYDNGDVSPITALSLLGRAVSGVAGGNRDIMGVGGGGASGGGGVGGYGSYTNLLPLPPSSSAINMLGSTHMSGHHFSNMSHQGGSHMLGGPGLKQASMAYDSSIIPGLTGSEFNHLPFFLNSSASMNNQSMFNMSAFANSNIRYRQEQVAFILAEQAFVHAGASNIVALPAFNSDKKLIGCFQDMPAKDNCSTYKLQMLHELDPPLPEWWVQTLEGKVQSMKKSSRSLFRCTGEGYDIESAMDNAFNYYNSQLL